MISQNTELYKKIFSTWYQPLLEAGCLGILDSLLPQLDVLYENRIVYPIKEKVFRVFTDVPYNKTKVILLGQDPYHSVHKQVYRTIENGVEVMRQNGPMPDACGYSFLTENGYYPPSLQNMFKELQSDENATTRNVKGALKKYKVENYPFDEWVSQGVLMLNAALTVEAGQPGSHSKFWKEFSRALIDYLAQNRDDIVWILLGSKAQELVAHYENEGCKIVAAAHPSPLAGGKFFGSKIYSRTNALLPDDKKIIW